MMHFEYNWEKIKNTGIGRMLDYTSAKLIYNYIIQYSPSVCVEFGTNQGRSACLIGMALRDVSNGHLHCFDPYLEESEQDGADLRGDNNTVFTPDRQYSIALKNILSFGLEDLVSLYRLKSCNCTMILDRADLVYIDGDHSPEGVRSDLLSADTLINNNGIVIVDNWYGDIIEGYNSLVSEGKLSDWVLHVNNGMTGIFHIARDK